MIITPVVMLATTLQDVDGAALYKRVLPSIATLSVVHKDGKSSLGTGFLAYKPGLMVTAWHVVENAKTVTAKFSDGEEFECTGIVDKDVSRDIAVIRVKAVGKPLLAVADEKPDVGAKAFIVGAPRGLEFSISDGIVSQIDTFDGKKIIQYTCPTSPGNSGGPLLDTSGKVRGVVSFLLKDSQNLNFAIPISYVSGFDLSLTTVPWDNVSVSDKTVAAVKPASSMNLEKFLLEVVRLDFIAGTAIMFPVSINNLFAGPPSPYIAAYRELLTYLEDHKTDDFKDNSQICKEALQFVSKWVEVIDNRIKSFEQNQGRSFASPTSMNYLKISNVVLDEMNSKSFSANFKKYIFTEPFMSRRPHGLRVQNSKMLLGLFAHPDTPLMIRGIAPWGYGSKVDLKVGDVIVGTDHGSINDLVDLEDIILTNLGTTVKIRVFRSNKEKEVEIKVPKQLSKEYLR